MKILHLSSENSWRGGEQQIAYLIKELDLRGVQNIVLCKKDSEFERYCIDNGIKHYTAPFKNNIDFGSAIDLRKVCDEEDPHIIHTHSSRAHSIAVYANWLGTKIPLVIARRVDFPIKNAWKYNFGAVKRIICVSDFIRKMVIPKLNDPSRCITIYSGVDTEKFKPGNKKRLLNEFGLEPDNKIVGNTSAIAEHKDYFTFVDTAELVLKERQDVTFFIIGEGPFRKMIEEYIGSKNLGKSIILTGFRNDIAEILPLFDCFLMTSKTEGLGTSLLDSLAAGVPVVATNGGGITEIIIHGQTGLVSNVGNSESLALQVKQILEDQALCNSFRTNGRLYVQEFSYQRMAEKTLYEYHKALN